MLPIKPLNVNPEFSHVVTLTSSLRQDGKRILEMFENEADLEANKDYKYGKKRNFSNFPVVFLIFLYNYVLQKLFLCPY